MLVITRREGQYIKLNVNGEEVTIHVTYLKGNQVRLGVDAARSVQIDRGEVVLDDALKGIKNEIKATCTDEEFVETWANMPIPILGNKTARELTSVDKRMLEPVLNEIKRNFQ